MPVIRSAFVLLAGPYRDDDVVLLFTQKHGRGAKLSGRGKNRHGVFLLHGSVSPASGAASLPSPPSRREPPQG